MTSRDAKGLQGISACMAALKRHEWPDASAVPLQEVLAAVGSDHTLTGEHIDGMIAKYKIRVKIRGTLELTKLLRLLSLEKGKDGNMHIVSATMQMVDHGPLECILTVTAANRAASNGRDRDRDEPVRSRMRVARYTEQMMDKLSIPPNIVPVANDIQWYMQNYSPVQPAPYFSKGVTPSGDTILFAGRLGILDLYFLAELCGKNRAITDIGLQEYDVKTTDVVRKPDQDAPVHKNEYELAFIIREDRVEKQRAESPDSFGIA